MCRRVQVGRRVNLGSGPLLPAQCAPTDTEQGEVCASSVVGPWPGLALEWKEDGGEDAKRLLGHVMPSCSVDLQLRQACDPFLFFYGAEAELERSIRTSAAAIGQSGARSQSVRAGARATSAHGQHEQEPCG